jgi:N-methylhydantoinase A/oxoprolinase/acetone carboxylase beta subunit
MTAATAPKGGTLRVGIDVGGTFTKAVAVCPATRELRAHAAVPTTHTHEHGVAQGVADALRALLQQVDRDAIELVAFSTTQAMNALLEGDVARVGVVGLGEAPHLRPARKRTRVGRIGLAPKRELETSHVFLDATGGIDKHALDVALHALAAEGCRAVAVSAAFAVDDPEQERFVCERAAACGLAACAGHELSGAYGLETRTVSAAVNASILPVVERTTALVAEALLEAGLDAPLLVLRGDGGAMSVEEFRRRPSFTIGSGPAAGVSAALHQLEVRDGIVVECGGTSSNVSVIKNGRPVLRTLRVMGRPTCVRSIDSWVVGAAGGSMPRVGRRKLEDVGPRSAHLADLRYACFATVEELADARLELGAPREGDPDDYATVRSAGGHFALTTTCAANALGLAAGAYASGSREAARLAFAPFAERLRTTVDEAAQRVLDTAARRIADAVDEAARQHELAPDVPLVALGGSGELLVARAAELLGRPWMRTEHPEVLSSIGAALSLVRVELTRNAIAAVDVPGLAHEAEAACIAAGAAPATVTVETMFDGDARVLRAVATGAVALETGAAHADPASRQQRLEAAAHALELPTTSLSLLAATDFYCVFSENGSGRVAVVDARAAVPVAEDTRRVFAAEGEEFLTRLRSELHANTRELGVATMLPRVVLVSGSRILDLSDARRADDVMAAAERALDGRGPAVALLSR